MTATSDSHTKGGHEEVIKSDATKASPSKDTEPGALAERPDGDKPPSKNEDLADDVAPTFMVNLSLSRLKIAPENCQKAELQSTHGIFEISGILARLCKVIQESQGSEKASALCAPQYLCTCVCG